jgi:hypothetical protein
MLLEGSNEHRLKFRAKTPFTHMKTLRLISLFTAAFALAASLGQAQPTLIAVGSLTKSRAGANALPFAD